MRRWVPVVLTATVMVVAAGCSSGGVDPEDVDGVPASWLEDTADGWPDSDAFGGSMPVLERGGCELADEPPNVLDADPEFTDVGWGPYGDDPSAENAYRYVCGLWAEDIYAGELQLIQAADADEVRETLADFEDQTSSPDQENEIGTAEVGQLEIHTLRRWYPTNPQGEYQAMHVDESAHAIATLEINSLDEDDFETYSAQQVAEDLVATMAAAG